MTRGVVIAVCLFAAAGLLCRAVPLAHAADGYQGLIAPSPEAQKKSGDSPNPAASGYQGLIAPAPDPRKPKQEPLGYSGLVPGRVEQKEAPTGVATVPSKTDELKAQAAIHGLPAGIKPPEKKTATASASRSGKPQRRINGMLPAEFAAKQNVDRMLAAVADSRLTPQARADRAKKAADRLNTLAGGLRQKNTVPAAVYKSMGISDTFIKEENEGNTRALARLDAALAELKRYQ